MSAATGAALPETCWMGIGDGVAVYRGPSLELAAHSGSGSCLAVGLDEEFTLRTDEGERTARSALIPPRLPHQLIAHGRRMAFCYLDAARDCRDLMRTTGGSVHYGHAREAELLRCGEVRTWLEIAGRGPVAPDDPRIAAALELLRTADLSAAELATRVHLSTSRFLHLFAQHAGTTFRRYRLWGRMLRTASGYAAGADLTTAATDAGFASPSHFSTAFRAMFGLSPSLLLATGTPRASFELL